jgi:predicted esterase
MTIDLLPLWALLLSTAMTFGRILLATITLCRPAMVLLFIIAAQICPGPAAEKVEPLRADDEAALKKVLVGFFSSPSAQQKSWKFEATLEKLLAANENAVRRVAWDAFKSAPIHSALKEAFEAKEARFEKYVSAYTVKTVGERPSAGWPLFIAMHGGGGAPKEVNDSQWRIMQRYYRDHPEAGGYLYVAPRAPNDTWNGFYDDYVYPLIANLIHEFVLFADVDPNKVFLMGYSHGGYGAFAIGPKEPDLFAAIHASAGAPTDHETTGKTLRNTVFSCMVGEKDTMYGRLERDQKFRQSIQDFRGDRTDIYPVTVTVIAGNGHTGLPDRDLIVQMYPALRNPVPRELTWLMTDKVIHDFFWLRTDQPAKAREIDATCRNNQLTVTTTTNVASASILLDSRLVDFGRPIVISLNGKTISKTLQPSLRTLCETMQRRFDPDLAFSAELAIPVSNDTNK